MTRIIFIKFLIIFQILSLQSCKKQTSKSENTAAMKETNKVYYIHYELGLPFSLYVNGIKIDSGSGNAVVADYTILNPFISSGINTISLEIKINDGNLTQEILNQIKLDLYEGDATDENSIVPFKTLTFSDSLVGVPIKFETWKFTPNVTFKNEQLKESLNLNEMDTEDLYDSVVAYYNEIHRIINAGDSEEYLKRFEDSNQRKMNAMYYDIEKQKKYKEGLAERVTGSKGFMKPLENYNLVIHPNGKIVTLENNDGGSPLFSVDSDGRIQTYGVMLYKPKNSENFKVY